MSLRRACLALLVLSVFATGGCGGSTPHRSEGHSRVVFGLPKSRPARAVVLLLHGGGWRGLDPAALAQQVRAGALFRRLGYATAAVDYRAGAQGLDDVVAAYDRVHHRFHGRPVCAIGASAGGHLALMLAIRRPRLACVISLAGPTNLRDAHTTVHDLAVRAFGESRLAQLSPVRQAHDIHARVLLVNATNDPVVPVSQARELIDARPGTRMILLPPGRTAFIHSRVDLDAARRAELAELRFLAAATRGSPPS